MGRVIFDSRGVVEAEKLALTPCAGDLNGLQLGGARRHQMKRQPAVAQNGGAAWGAGDTCRGELFPKESFSKDADPALIETIAANNDIVLTAIGD